MPISQNQIPSILTESGRNTLPFMSSSAFVEIAPQRYPKYNAYWWQYKEAGTYNGYIDIVAVDSGKSTFVAPKVDKPETLHLILEVTDTGIPALTTFARVIVTIFPTDK